MARLPRMSAPLTLLFSSQLRFTRKSCFFCCCHIYYYKGQNKMIDSREYTNPFYNSNQLRKQEWAIGPWLRKKGMKVADLDTHPQIDNLIALITIRDELWSAMTHREQCSWGKYWDLVYQYRYPLTNKFWNKFQRIAQNIDNRQHTRQQIENIRKQGSR